MAAQSDQLSIAFPGEDKPFEELLKDITESTITWKHFLEMTIPKGLTVSSTWRLIHEINHSAGSSLPRFSLDKQIFYRYSMDVIKDYLNIHHILLRVASRQSSVEFENNKAFFIDTMKNVISAARLDGFEISEDKIIQAFDKGCFTLSESEHLVVNGIKMELNISDYQHEELTVDLLRQLHRELLEGISLDDIPNHTSIRLSLIPQSENIQGETSFDERAISVMKYLEGTLGETSDLLVVRNMIVSDLLHTFVPIGGLASLIGSSLSKLMFHQTGIPLMSKLPLAFARYHWEVNEDAYPSLFCTRQEIVETQQQEINLGLFDITLLQTVLIQLALNQVERLAAFVDSFAERNDAVKTALMQNIRFNNRQKNIIARAAKGSDRKFTIRYHETHNSISYATARRDFQELVDSGYLRYDFRGKTQIFQASDQLDALLNIHIGLSDEIGIDYSKGLMSLLEDEV